MMRRLPRHASLAILAAGLAAAAAAQPANLRDATLSLREVPAGGLAAAVRQVSASGRAPAWIGWLAPLADPRRQMCCYGPLESWSTEEHGRPCCGRCRLEREGAFSMNRDARRSVLLEEPDEFLLMLRATGGRVEKIRSYDLLRVAVGRERETETRKHLTFALSQSPVPDVKRKAVFALTQLPGDGGIPKLIQVARTNRNPEVREQAIFWLGQSKDPRALDFIEEILLR
jgi:hypothetical protein